MLFYILVQKNILLAHIKKAAGNVINNSLPQKS